MANGSRILSSSVASKVHRLSRGRPRRSRLPVGPHQAGVLVGLATLRCARFPHPRPGSASSVVFPCAEDASTELVLSGLLGSVLGVCCAKRRRQGRGDRRSHGGAEAHSGEAPLTRRESTVAHVAPVAPCWRSSCSTCSRSRTGDSQDPHTIHAPSDQARQRRSSRPREQQAPRAPNTDAPPHARVAQATLTRRHER